jgi:hypothetical protein
MKTLQLRWQNNEWVGSSDALHDAQLILVFGAGKILRDDHVRAGLRARAPQAKLVGCSTAGEILGTDVSDDGAVAMMISFDSTQVTGVYRQIPASDVSETVGTELGRAVSVPGLRHVLVLSNGLNVNGTQLVAGIRSELPEGVSATGGLAGDGPRFEDTTIVFDDEVKSDGVVVVGLYGSDLEVHLGSAGGWEAFGPRRKITRAESNVLFELDGKPALELYKTYLGERAAGLPATGLLFPLELLSENDGEPSLVRTILAVDEENQSLTFAGDVPQGRYVRLMKSTIDKLIWGAENAGEMASSPTVQPEMALLVSCVGRRLVLNQRAEEEVEAVLTELENPPGAIGFYPYGEIGPGGVSHG